MPRLLTPLATLPLYAVVKPTLAATAILQPQTAIITQQIPPSVTSATTPQPTVIQTSSSAKHVPESGTFRFMMWLLFFGFYYLLF